MKKTDTADRARYGCLILLCHVAASFAAALVFNTAVDMGMEEPVFCRITAGFCAVSAAVLAGIGAGLLSKRTVSDRFSPTEDGKAWEKLFLRFVLPEEGARILLSLLLPGALTQVMDPGGTYLAEAVFYEGEALAWRASLTFGRRIVCFLCTAAASALFLAVCGRLWKRQWKASEDAWRERIAVSGRDENKSVDRAEDLRARYSGESPLFRDRPAESGTSRKRNEGERKGRSVKEILADGILVFLLMTVAGLASNVIPALLGFFLSMPVAAEGYTDTREQLLWLLFAASAMLFCMGTGIFFARFIGGRAADYRISNGQRREPDALTAFLSVGIGVTLHGAACLPLALNQLGNLFYAGPVQYIARYLGHGRHALFQEDMFDFPVTVKLEALLLYLLFFAAAVTCGYLLGFRRRVEDVEWREEAARYDEQMRARDSGGVWSARDVEAAHVTEENAAALAREEKPERETLARDTEAFFRAFDRRERVKFSVLIVLWILADVGIWLLWSKRTGRELLSPYAIPFTALLIPPFYPFRWHERLTKASYYGEVIAAEMKQELTAATGMMRSAGRIRMKETPRLLVRSKMGLTEEILYRPGTHLPYRKGQKVFRLGSVKYPVPCSFDEDDRIFCPRCGFANIPGYDRCRQCRAKLGRRK